MKATFLQESPWKSINLGSVVESMKNGIYKPREAYSDSGVACLRMYNIEGGKIIWKDIKRMRLSEDEIREYGLLPGDLLINRVNSRELVGKAAVIRPGLERCVFESKNIRVRLKTNIVDPQFASFALLANGQAHFNRNAQQVVGMASISQPQVAAFSLPLPPLDEQKRIVADIEKQFTRLDAGMASLKCVQTALKRYRASMLKAACEGRLVPTEAELARKENRSYETGQQLLQRILEERREEWNGKGRYKEAAGIELGAPPAIPEGWIFASAEAVCRSVRDGTHDTPQYVAEGVPLITSKNLLSTGLDFEKVKLISREDHIEIGKRSGVQRGDILFAMIGTVGNPVVVTTDREFSVKNVGLFKANPNFIVSSYLRYWLMSPQFVRWLEPKQKGTTQKFVPLGLLRSLVVALPPFPEQQRIVAELDRRFSVIEDLEAVVNASIDRSIRFRQSILSNAFQARNGSE